MMGRKDADRFKKIEDRLDTLENKIHGTMRGLGVITENEKNILIKVRDLFTKLIEGE